MLEGATATEKSHFEDARHKNNNRRAIFGKYWNTNIRYCTVNGMGINTMTINNNRNSDPQRG